MYLVKIFIVLIISNFLNAQSPVIKELSSYVIPSKSESTLNDFDSNVINAGNFISGVNVAASLIKQEISNREKALLHDPPFRGFYGDKLINKCASYIVLLIS